MSGNKGSQNKEIIKLYKMYQKASGMNLDAKSYELKLTNQEGKIFGKETSTNFVDSVSAYASNGEFFMSFEDFVEEVNEELKNV